LAVAGIWPLLHGLGARSWLDLGLVKPAGQWRRLGAGFALGFTSLAVVAILALAAGARAFNPLHPALASKLLSAALTASVVAVLEEILFRGGVFGGFRRVFSWRKALLLSSLIYALLHFLESARLAGPVLWYSGLELLPRMMRGFINWRHLLPGLFNLAMAGLLLGLAYQRTGNLYFSIGLHAGWIFWLRSYGALTRPVPGVDPWFWGTSALINGWLALLALSTLLVLSLNFPRPVPSSPAGLLKPTYLHIKIR
jgi:membrane protease YdiL (CAAX protease family)